MPAHRLVAAVLAACLLAACAGAQSIPFTGYTPTMTLPQGQLFGGLNDAGSFFLGLPYAAPPVGNLMFSPTAPAAPWSGVRNATSFGAFCPQTCDLPGCSATPMVDLDCLFLNVFVPPTPPNSSLGYPVQVYIPGGCFTMGGASYMSAQQWALIGNVVVVTINYRLGAIGFLYTGSGSSDINGNFGILDQLQSLQWVKDNIAAFGGDANRVVIVGESSGATSVATLITCPRVKGLINGAIVMSNPYTAGLDPEGFGKQISASFISMMGCQSNTLECLRNANVTTMMSAQANATRNIFASKWLLFAPLDIACGWGPVPDGAVIPMQPFDAMRKGAFAQVPLLWGTVENEGQLFSYEVSASFNKGAPYFTFGQYTLLLEALFGAINGARVHLEFPYHNATSERSMSNIFTYYVFRCSLRALSRAVSITVPVFQYKFSAPLNASVSKAMGPWAVICANQTCHGEDVAFLFSEVSKVSPSFADLSMQLVTAWTNFAHTFNPNYPVALNVTEQWPQYSASNDATFLLEMPLGVTSGVDDAMCNFFDKLGY